MVRNECYEPIFLFLEEAMKKYTVMIIGESGKYETVASGVNGRLAGALAKHYRANGVWVQTKEEEQK